ncbi:MAG: Holliday junction branch migration protein RuvA [Clostridia bacterium]|nr:Holliday junction branch migration protein RuvA [Clostridia bacterium]
MFYYISGKLALLQPGFAVVDAGGVGYRLTISQNTYDSLPRSSADAHKDVRLYTYMAIREDDIELFGFASETELSSFKMLLTVSGVGPKAAISILSLLTPEKFALAVCTEDQKTISKASGIGPKTAARIILELKDKLMKETPPQKAAETLTAAITQPGTSQGKLSEAQDALMVLGYSRAEALSAMQGLDISAMELEDIIRASLKKLMK